MLEPRRLGYQSSLNGLRAVAVGLVMAHHAVAFLVPVQHREQLLPGGFIGVDIFFVLSGFLITTLLLEECQARRTIDIRRFYARRALRLFPALATLLIVTLTAAYLFEGESLKRVGYSATVVGLYVVNWAKTFVGDVTLGLGHTWSLAVEEQFYLIWPLLVLFAFRKRLSVKTMQRLVLGGIAVSFLIKVVLWIATDGVAERIYFRTDARADALLIGALLALAWHQGSSLERLRPLTWPAVAVIVGVALTTGLNSAWLFFGGFTFIGFASAVVIAALLDRSEARSPGLARALAARPLVHVGAISYGLYLWHVPVYAFLARHVHLPTVPKIVVGVLATLAVAELSMLVVEKPFLRLKQRLELRPTVEPDPYLRSTA